MQYATLAVGSTALPTLRWACPSCRHREFRCSERLRMNSNGKVADIWLLYRCGECAATKNLTVLERAPIGRIPPALITAATHNDPTLVRRLARDVSLVKRGGARIARGDQYQTHPVPFPAPITVTLRFEEPLLVRLDQVLAEAFTLPRARVADLARAGILEILSTSTRIDKLRLWANAEVRLDSM